MMDKRLTIFTPTYNRAYILPQLYETLCQQQCTDFVWLVVDDGSSDDTPSLLQEWQAEGKISIRYYQQANGGKMRAHNYGATLCDTLLFMCVDSDDYLASPTVVGDVLASWDAHRELVERPDVCGLLTYRKMIPDAGGTLVDDLQLCTMGEVYARGFRGETAPVFKAEVLRQYPFPVCDGEKFITEDVVFDQLSLHYQFLLFPYETQVCEYQQDGYTRNGWDVLYRNPKGYRLYYDQLVRNGRPNLIYHEQMFIASSLLAADGQTFSSSSRKWLTLFLFPLGLYQYFKLKRRKW